MYVCIYIGMRTLCWNNFGCKKNQEKCWNNRINSTINHDKMQVTYRRTYLYKLLKCCQSKGS